jgi:hypothetical protein
MQVTEPRLQLRGQFVDGRNAFEYVAGKQSKAVDDFDRLDIVVVCDVSQNPYHSYCILTERHGAQVIPCFLDSRIFGTVPKQMQCE